MSGLDFWNFFVKKPLTYVIVKLEGEHVKSKVESDIDSLEPVVQTALASEIGTSMASVVTSKDVTLSTAESLIMPQATNLIDRAIGNSNVPDQYKAQVTAWANTVLETLIGTAYNDAVNNIE